MANGVVEVLIPSGSDGEEPACSAGEPGVRSLGQEDPLEKGMATHSCLENSMDRGAWGATQSTGLHRVGHD